VCAVDNVYDCSLSLRNAKLYNLLDTEILKHRFKISTDNVAHMFICTTEIEKEEWMKAFTNSCIIIQATQRNKSLKEGYLLKQSLIRKSWVKRFFVLDESFLYYYHHKPEDDEVLVPKSVQLNEYVLMKYPENIRAHAFALSSDTKPTLLISAQDSAERDQWIKVIKPMAKPSERNSGIFHPVHPVETNMDKN